MHVASVNLLAVATAAVTAFGLNFIWFTLLFRRLYTSGLGRTQAELDQGPSILIASILQLAGFAVSAFILGWLMARLGLGSIKGGIGIAVTVWLGFIAAVIVPMHAFQAYPLSFTLITIGGYLVALLVTGVILGVWR